MIKPASSVFKQLIANVATRIAARLDAIAEKFAAVEMTFERIGCEALSGNEIVRMMAERGINPAQLAAKLGTGRGLVHWMRVNGSIAGLDSLKLRTALAAC